MSFFSKEQLYTSTNRRMSQGLFKETCIKQDNVIATLMSFDERWPRLIDQYVFYCAEDPTEYKFAIAVFGNWEFWTNIRDKDWFQPYYSQFKEEAEVKRKSIAFKAVIDEVEKGGASGVNAAKFLIQEPWKEPTRETKAQKVKTTQRAKAEYSDDLKRLREEGFLDAPKH